MEALWDDYKRFHGLSLATRDVDPVYPVLKQLLRSQAIDPTSDIGVWLSIAHLTWYHIGSGTEAWSRGWPQVPAPDGLPCSTERRGNRVPANLRANIAGWVAAAELYGGILNYFMDGMPVSPVSAWKHVMIRTQMVPGNGRWASYKLAEMLNKVNGIPLMFGDMGHADSTGPRKGLELLYTDLPQGNSPHDVAYLDAVSQGLVSRLHAAGYDAPIEETETTLCDFHALYAGRYYVGHDIDQMLEQIHARPGPWLDDLLQARYDTLPHPYLGELQGWTGVDKDRNKLYRDSGLVAAR